MVLHLLDELRQQGGLQTVASFGMVFLAIGDPLQMLQAAKRSMAQAGGCGSAPQLCSVMFSSTNVFVSNSIMR